MNFLFAHSPCKTFKFYDHYNDVTYFYTSENHDFYDFPDFCSIPVLALSFYAPRLPTDPLARSECIRSFTCSFRPLQAPCLGTTLGGTPPPEPHPQGSPPPGTPHPTPTPLVRVEGYSKWMVIPSGWLFRVHGYPKRSKFDSNKQGRAQTQSMQKTLTALVDHCTFCPVTTRRCW
jgi:hypothetical protein